MNYQTLVKLSNVIGLIAITALVYWVFIFIVSTVFKLRVFREGITETFLLSVLGILAVMAGALMVNVMFNLTRIAEKLNQGAPVLLSSAGYGKWLLFVLAFPVIAALLFAGDRLSAQKKEKVLIESARTIFASSPDTLAQLLEYRFDRSWICAATDTLELYRKTDSAMDNIELLVQDKVDDLPVFLEFGIRKNTCREESKNELRKQDFIRKTTLEERNYLESVFSGRAQDIRFSAKSGRYELFYPYTKNNRTVIFYFSDYQRYGKFGS